MSIYGRRKGLIDFDRVDSVSSTDVAAGGRGSPVSPRKAELDASPYEAMRKAAPANYLLPTTVKWLRELPVEVAPAELAVEFPRILNLVAHQWRDRRFCPNYLDDLLVDRRGGRRGFPAAVYSEIQALRNYWYAHAS